MPVKLLSQILNILQIGKIIVKKYVFENFPTFFWNYQKRNICITTLVDEYVCKISSPAILKKRLSLTVLNAQKATFYAISEDLGIFPILNVCPIWTV